MRISTSCEKPFMIIEKDKADSESTAEYESIVCDYIE